MPGLEAAQALEAIIGRAVEREHIEPILQKRDERQEMFAIEAVLVEILGWPVRCRDYRDAVADDPGKQPGQDHGVSRIGDDHLVERNQPGLPCDRIGHRSEEHTSELQSLMRISYAVFCLKKKTLSICMTLLIFIIIHTRLIHIL